MTRPAAFLPLLLAVVGMTVAHPALAKRKKRSGPRRPPMCDVLMDPARTAGLSGGTLSRLRAVCDGQHKALAQDAKLPAGNGLELQTMSSGLFVNVTGGTYPYITENSPAVAVSPTNSNNVVVAYRKSHGSQGVGWSTSSNGGGSWTDHGSLQAPAGGGSIFSEPAVTADHLGNFYVATVNATPAHTLAIGVARSTNGGSSFSQSVRISQDDARYRTQAFDWPNIVADTSSSSSHQGRIYACYLHSYTCCSDPTIDVVHSDDQGLTWSPFVIAGQTALPLGCSMAVGSTGRVYLTYWAYDLSRVYFASSTDGGSNFTSSLSVASAFRPQWDYDCNRVALNGHLWQVPVPRIAAEGSSNAYIVYSSWSNDNQTPGRNIARFISTTSSGTFWSSPHDLASSTTNDQFFPQVAATSSEVHVLWLDRRNSATNTDYDVYEDHSTNGGASWAGNRRLTATSLPAPQLDPNFDCGLDVCYFGEYVGLTAQTSTSFARVWTDTRLSASGTACAAGRASSAPDPNIRGLVGNDSACDTLCDDGNPCTSDSCTASGGCVHSPLSTGTCSDGNACTTGDHCSAGVCVGGTTTTCNDSNPCTNDACNPATGACVFTNNTNPCNDQNPCTPTDRCSNGSCVGSGSINCNDGNPCTADSCNPADGQCLHTNTDGVLCTDGNSCTTNDHCVGGLCVGGCNTGAACAPPCGGHCGGGACTCQ